MSVFPRGLRQVDSVCSGVRLFTSNLFYLLLERDNRQDKQKVESPAEDSEDSPAPPLFRHTPSRPTPELYHPDEGASHGYSQNDRLPEHPISSSSTN